MKWSLARQLHLGFAVACLLVLGVTVATWWVVLDYKKEIVGAYDTQLRTTVQLAEAQSAFWQLRFGARQFMIEELTGQQQILEQQHSWYAIIEERLAAYNKAAGSTDERRTLTSLRATYQRYKQARAKFFALWQAGEKDDAIAWLALTLSPFGAQAGQAFETQIALQRSFAVQAQAASERQARAAIAVVTAITVVLLGMLALAYAYSLRLLRPIRALGAQAQRVLRERLGETLDTATHSNEVTALVESFQRMSDRLLAHSDSLRQLNERLDFLLNATPASIWTSEVSAPFDRTFLSPNVRALLGYEPEDFLRDPGFWSSNIHPDDRQRVLAGLAMIEHEDSHTHEYRFRHKNGSWHWMRAELKVHRDNSGAPVELVGYWIDISARVRADEERAQALERLQSTLQGARVAVWDADEAGNIWLSQEWAELFGQAGSETWTTLQGLIALAEPKDRERVRNTVVALAKGQSSEFSEEYLVRNATGQSLWLHLQGRVIRRTAAGRAARMSGTARDITARKQAEEQLQLLADRLALANSVKTDFMASITHELRTPLNSVIGFAELLKDEVPGPLNATQAQFAADILAGGQRLLMLVEAILEMSRLDAADRVLAREPVDIGALLEERVAAHRKAAASGSITMRLDVAPDAGSLALDPRALRRMMDVLLDNAIKFNREGGAVAVSARRASGALEISVADTGIGIAQEDMARLFKPLVQLDAGLARRHGGIGLGLALARRLAVQHGGTIEVQSESGQGSTFTVHLPLQENS